MNRSLLALAPAVLTVLAGCASVAPAASAKTAVEDLHALPPAAPVADEALANQWRRSGLGLDDDALGKRAELEADAAVGHRRPGDYVVYRYSGSFTKHPLTLRERVIARDGTALVLELELTEDKQKTTLRARVEHGGGARARVTDVQRIEAGKARAATVEDYEALLGKTVLAADDNDGEIDRDAVTIQVAGKPLAAEKTRYRVHVAGKPATLVVLSQEGFAWGDVGGELIGPTGQPIYRAELVETGTGPAPAALATSDDE